MNFRRIVQKRVKFAKFTSRENKYIQAIDKLDRTSILLANKYHLWRIYTYA